MQRSFVRIVRIALLVLVALPATAFAAPDLPPELDGRQPAGVERLADLLLLEADALAGAEQLEIVYSVDGLPFFAEALRTADVSEEEGTRVVELLAWHPEIRQRLLGLATGGALVTASVLRDGVASAPIVLTDLAAASRELQRTPIVPLKSESVVTYEQAPDRARVVPKGGLQSITAAAKDPACVQQCQDEYDFCEEQCQTSGGWAPDCFERCDADFNSCYNGCPETCTGPTTREWDETVVAGATYLGYTRCLTWGFTPYLFDFMRITYKTTRYRETTQCDGTKTTEVVSVTYSTYDCWLRSWQQCYPSVGDSFYYFTCPY